MPNQMPSKEKIKQVILQAIGDKELDRKIIIANAIKNYGFDASELKDTSCESVSSRCKSISGIVINELLAENLIIYNNDKIAKIKEEPLVLMPPKVLNSQEIIDFILEKRLSKQEFKDSSPSGNKNKLKARLGNIIKRKYEIIEKLPSSTAITFIEGELDNRTDEARVAPNKKQEIISTEVINIKKTEDKKPTNNLKNNQHNKNIPTKASSSSENSPVIAPSIHIKQAQTTTKIVHKSETLEDRLEKLESRYNDLKEGRIKAETYKSTFSSSLMECISLAGGEFFERLSMKLLLSVYGDSVKHNEITAGVDDNGIDGIIVIEDPLGMEEKIVIQAKTKHNQTSNIPTKTTREFVGVMTAFSAHKGILITNSVFHKDAIKFAQRVSNLLLIDKSKLYKLMLKTGIGIKEIDGIPVISKSYFLD